MPGLAEAPHLTNETVFDLTERPDAYRRTELQPFTAPGTFTVTLKDWKPGDVMELRVVVKHPLITTYSKEQRFTVR